MAEKRSREPEIPDDLRDRLDALLVEYVSCAKKERAVRSEAHAQTAEMRFRMSDIFRKAEKEAAQLAERREAIAEEFSAAWQKHFPKVPCAVFPSATVARRTFRTLDVRDKEAVIDVLDRLDRLDLVEQVIDEKGLLKLSRAGALDDVPEEALRVIDAPALQVNLGKEGE